MDLRNGPTPSLICAMIEGSETDVRSLRDARVFTYAHHKFLGSHSASGNDEESCAASVAAGSVFQRAVYFSY
jgi:hypothetical protein